MQLKTIFKLALLISTITVISMELQIQKPEWKGKIEYENGVKVIKNPSEPLYGKITFELEEDLSIGNEKDENYMFYGGLSIGVDLDGNISVLDIKNCRIQKYDKDGKYIQTIGRKGQGPGEFEHPARIDLDSENNIYVKDGFHIDIFDKNGEFKERCSPVSNVVNFGITNKGNILAQTYSEKSSDIILLNSEWKDIKTIESFPIEKGAMFRNPYSPELYFCPLNEELSVYGYSSQLWTTALKGSSEKLPQIS